MDFHCKLWMIHNGITSLPYYSIYKSTWRKYENTYRILQNRVLYSLEQQSNMQSFKICWALGQSMNTLLTVICLGHCWQFLTVERSIIADYRTREGSQCLQHISHMQKKQDNTSICQRAKLQLTRPTYQLCQHNSVYYVGFKKIPRGQRIISKNNLGKTLKSLSNTLQAAVVF